MKALGSVNPNARKKSGEEEVGEKRRKEGGKKGRKEGEKGWFPFIHWTSALF